MKVVLVRFWVVDRRNVQSLMVDEYGEFRHARRIDIRY